MSALTLYYDGRCPFCCAEMARLARWDLGHKAVLAFVDNSLPGFDPAHLNATREQIDAQLYGRTADGRVLVGIDTMLAAYTLAGKGWLVWPLRVPGLRGVLSFLYRAFARNRYTMSRVLGYRGSACDDGVCTPGNPFLGKRSPK